MTTLKEKISHARSRLVVSHPFFGSIIYRLPLIERKGMLSVQGGPWATDGAAIYYDPDYAASESVVEIVTELGHEAMHVALLHCVRAGTREPKKWNVAIDYVVNHVLAESGFQKLKDWIHDDTGKFLQSDKDDPDESVIMGADTIYNMLPEGGGQGGGGNGNVHIHVMPHPSTMSDKEKEKVKSEGDVHPDIVKAMEMSPQQAEAETIVMVAQSAMVAKQCGKLPGSLEKLVDTIVNPRIPWVDVLRRFMEHNCKNDYSWMTPSRRYFSQGLFIPSLNSQQMGPVVIAVDVSGSVSDDEMSDFCSETSGILEMCNPEVVHFVQVDTSVSHVEEYNKHDLPLKVTRRGFGGTSFRPPFEWVEKEGIQPACLIYMTDMCCHDFPEAPDYPVLWLASGNWNYNGRDWPFGEIIEMHR